MKKRRLPALHDSAYLARFMTGLHEDQRKLNEIQSAYDNLALLGQLLCSGTDIGSMRTDFSNLAQELLDHLAAELRTKVVRTLRSDARVAIDVLVRNLFERTADIGFLSMDRAVRDFAAAAHASPNEALDAARIGALQERFYEYVRKYSVYHNIMLLAPDGRVLVQLDENNVVERSSDALIAEVISGRQEYVEVFRPTDLLPGQASPLIYAGPVMNDEGDQVVGVLCLCFRFEDECQRIFDSLLDEDAWSVITLLDDGGRVIASSDVYQFPPGAVLTRGEDGEAQIVRFAGREYLAATCHSHGYQGYEGPGWVGHALSPLNHAFEMSGSEELDGVADEIRGGVLEKTTLFSDELRSIPLRATRIQGELNRAVWNGTLWLARDSEAFNGSFAKVLLWEIAGTGVKTRNVFSESTTNLYETVVSAVLYDCAAQAGLAMDIMDRNLYERANDCRWWALTTCFREALQRGGDAHALHAQMRDTLRRINDLYTVYTNLLVFDRSARIVSVSNPAENALVGETLQAEWVRETLALPDTQCYCVSRFSDTSLYDERPTYVYAAAIRDDDGDPAGGIAIVFDSEPQFDAMLEDALPRTREGDIVKGAFALFVERDGQVVASTDAAYRPGSRIELAREFFALQPGEAHSNIIVMDGRYYAVGSRMSAGYREYKSVEDTYRNELFALVLVPLSDSVSENGVMDQGAAGDASRHLTRPSGSEDTLEVATFYIGDNWFGVPARQAVEVIVPERFTPVPGMPAWVRGCVMYRERAISVFDLSAMTTDGRRCEGQQVVVLEAPGQEAFFGIVVDALGDIPEVPLDRVEPVPPMFGQRELALAESLVRPDSDAPDACILAVLSLSAIVRRLSAGVPLQSASTVAQEEVSVVFEQRQLDQESA